MTSKFIYKAIRIKGAFELIIIIYDRERETSEREGRQERGSEHDRTQIKNI